MTLLKQPSPFRSLSALLSGSSPGASFVFTFERQEILHEIVPFLLASVSDGQKPLLVSRRGPPGTTNKRRKEILTPTEIRRGGAQVRKLRASIARIKGTRLLVVDPASFWRIGARSLTLLINASTETLRKKRVTSVWLLPTELYPTTSLGDLHGADFIGSFSAGESKSVTFQLIHSAVPGSPDLYTRREVLAERGRLVFAPSPKQQTGSSTAPVMSEMYEQMVRTSPEGFVLFDPNGGFRTINPSGSRMTGIGQNDLRTEGFEQLVHESSRRTVLRVIAQLRTEASLSTFVRFRKRNRRVVEVHVHAFRVSDRLWCISFGEHPKSSGSTQDDGPGSDSRDAWFQRLPLPQVIFDDRRLIRTNALFDGLMKDLGRTNDLSTVPRFLGKENKGTASEVRSLSPGASGRWVVSFATPEGPAKTFLFFVYADTLAAKRVLHCMLVDVTREDTALREVTAQREDLLTVLRHSGQSLATVSGGVFTFVNHAFARLLGHEGAGSLTGKTIENILAPRGRKRLLSALRETIPSGETLIVEHGMTRSDGTQLSARSFLSSCLVAGKSAVLLSVTDATAEEAGVAGMKREIQELGFLQSVEEAFSSSIDLHQSLSEGLHSMMRRLHAEMGAVCLPTDDGWSVATSTEVPAAVLSALASSDQHQGLSALVLKTAEPLSLHTDEYPPHIPYRSLFETEGIAQVFCVPLISGGRVIGMIFLASRKKTAPALAGTGILRRAGVVAGNLVDSALKYHGLRSLEARYRQAIEDLPDVVYRMNRQGIITYISPNVKDLLLYDPSMFTRSAELLRQAVHPDDRTTYGRRMTEGDGKGGRIILEYRVLPKGKAEYRWVRDSVMFRRDGEGRLESMTGSLRDITGEKEHLDRLLQSESLKTNILESISEGVAVYDQDLKCRDWNRAMEDITGLNRSSIIGLPIGHTTERIISRELVAMLRSALGGQTMSSDDIILNKGIPGTSEEYYWVRCFPLRGSAGPIQGVVLTFTNVSARRALEQSVRESEETLRNVIDGMGDALMISDLQGRVWEVNKEFTNLTGYSRREVLGMSFPYPWLVEEEMARFVSWIAALREQSYLRDFDMTWRSRTGTSAAISINTSLLRNAVGEPVAMLNIARDISDRKRLMTELERRNRQLETLNAVSSSISTSLRVDDVIRVAVEQIRELMEARVVLIYLTDRRGDRLVLRSHAGLSSGEAEKIRDLHPTESATGTVITSGTPLMIDSGVLDDPRITDEGRDFLRDLSLQSLGVVPLRSKEEVLGALDVAFTNEHVFTPEERQFLMLIGSQLGAAIENAQLYGEVRRQVTRLTSLYEVARGLTGALDLRTILNTVYEEVRKAVPADRFTYYQLNAMRRTLSPVVSEMVRGTEDAAPTPADISLDAVHPFADAIDNTAVRFARDAETGEGMIIAPVKSGQSVAGLIVVAGSSRDMDDEAHLRLLESIANLTEIALEKASLYVDIVTKSREIEARNKDLDDFTYVVSHDLKEPLISIEGYSKILLKEYEGQVGPEGKEYLGSLINSSTRLKNLIDDLLTLSRLGRVSEAVGPVSLSEIVRDVLQDIRFTLREHHATVEVQGDLPTVVYNPTQLGIVVRNLVSNGIKFNARPDPRVDISCETLVTEYLISVRDNGIGIEERYFDKIFMIFQRLHRTEEYRGTGAGLTIVKKIVENHGGRIEVRSVHGEGSTFSFTIPRKNDHESD